MKTQRVGERLKAARERAGLSQTQVGERIGAHLTTVSRWERGAPIKTEALRKLAALYGVSAGELLGESAAPDTSEPAAPGEADGLEGVERHTAEWWSGYQRAALHMMEHAASMQDTAIKMQRELIAATYPTPRQITPAQEAALEAAETAIRLRDAVRAEEARASGARRRGGQAG